MKMHHDEEMTKSDTERIDLRTLVDHRESVQGDENVGDVYRAFPVHGHEYVAVLDGEHLLGLCSRGQIGCLLGSRFGFMLSHQKAVKNHLLENHRRIPEQVGLMEVLHLALSRNGEAFYDDVVLIDDADRFLGVISIKTLIQLQSRVCDVRRAGMTGIQLFQWIQSNRPPLASRFLFITGDTGGSESSQQIDALGVPVLRKPFSLDFLTRECRSMVSN